MKTTTSLNALLLHADWTHALARRLVADPGFAADAAQETLLRAVRAQPNVASPRAWLGRVLRNVVRDERRRERPEALGDVEPASGMVQRAESHEQVVRAVLLLAEKHRDVLLERYFEGRTPKEIARRKGVAVQTISNRLTKAHAALRAKLEREGGSEWLAGIAPLLRVEAAPVGALATAVLVATCVAVIGGGAWWAATRPSVPSREHVVAVAHASAPAPESAAVPIQMSTSIDDEQSARLPVETVATVDTSKEASPAPPPTGSIAGTVLDVTGEPYRDLLLALHSNEASHEVRTDSSGDYRLKGVAANSDVTLTIDLAGETKHEENLRLAPDAVLQHDIVLANVTRIEGRVVDEEGKGVGDRRVVLAQPRGLGREFFRRRSNKKGQVLAEVITDKHGEFTFELVPSGKYIIGVEGRVADVEGSGHGSRGHVTAQVRASGRDLFGPRSRSEGLLVDEINTNKSGKFSINFAGDFQPGSKHTTGFDALRVHRSYSRPLLQPLVVPPRTLVQQVELLDADKHTIRGRIETWDGLPVDNVILLATLKSVSGSLRADSFDGKFEFKDVPDGEYSIFTNQTPDGLCEGEARDVPAGADDVLIVLEPGGGLAVEIFDPSGALTDGWYGPLPGRRNAGPTRTPTGSLKAGQLQTRHFDSLSPATYCLAAWSDVDGLYGFVPDVEVGAGDDVSAVRVRLEPSAWLDLKHEGQAKSVRIRVFRGESMLRSSAVRRGESKRIAVPPGQLEVHFVGGDTTSKHDVWVDVGQAAELTNRH